MCGIAGIWNLNNVNLNREALVRFTDSLKHRGPDGFGYYMNESGDLGLGHRRLSVLDLSENGKQPMSFADGRYWITYNGEIYNFIELRDELKQLGYSFISDSDTEVILVAYHKWGKDCLARFNGMWAFAIWDSVEKNIFFARDRFGIKPLHILFISNKILAFASETIAFKSLQGYKRSLNELNLASVLQDSFSLEGYGKTIFNDINQLPGGHYCFFSKENSSLNFKRWWNTLDNFVEAPRNFEEQVIRFKELFFDSCRLRLRSDVPIATALSGGLDSSSVYSTIKYFGKQNISTGRVPSDWQTAFVATFPGAENDERDFAAQLINAVNGKGVFIVPDEAEIVDHIVSTTKLFDSIILTPLSVVVDVYRSMRMNGYRVSLDGHGVDEMLYGYPHSLASAYSSLTNAHQGFLAEDVKRTFEGLFLAHVTPPSLGSSPLSHVPAIKTGLKGRIKPFIPKSALAVYRSLKGKNHELELTRNWINMYNTAMQVFDESSFFPGINQLSELDRNIFREFHLSTLPTILRNFDRAAMQSGIEVRMPFMDWRLVTFVFSLPFSSKVNEGYTKNILRHAMKGIVPDSIRLRKTKIGFNAPMPLWFSKQLKSFIFDEVNSLSFSNSEIWNANKIKLFVDQKSKNGWSWDDCALIWPYLNAHIISKDN